MVLRKTWSDERDDLYINYLLLVGTVGAGTVGTVWDERDSFSNDISSFRASTMFFSEFICSCCSLQSQQGQKKE